MTDVNRESRKVTGEALANFPNYNPYKHFNGYTPTIYHFNINTSTSLKLYTIWQ